MAQPREVIEKAISFVAMYDISVPWGRCIATAERTILSGYVSHICITQHSSSHL